MRRNADESMRELERAARMGDLAAALRYGLALRRAGLMDQATEESISLLDQNQADDLMARWAITPGSGRIRLYRALHAAGIRYPAAAFLAALSGEERMLCCVSACMGGASERWSRRLEALGLQQSPHNIELVYPDRRGFMYAPDRDGNQDQYRGREGLEKAREEGARIEAEWAELVKATVSHKSGGFVEHTTFLTPDGYAQRSVYYHAASEQWREGVSHWDYDVRHGFLSDAQDPVERSMNLDLSFVSKIHALELKVQSLLDSIGGRYTETPQEHIPGHLTERAARSWMGLKPKILVEFNSPVGGYSGPSARCLVVIPAATGEPPVTIGISSNSGDRITARMRRITPAHYWPELGPWSTPVNKRLEKRLADWAATDAPDRVRVEGNVALVWQQWERTMRERLNEMQREQNERRRAEGR